MASFRRLMILITSIFNVLLYIYITHNCLHPGINLQMQIYINPLVDNS